MMANNSCRFQGSAAAMANMTAGRSTGGSGGSGSSGWIRFLSEARQLVSVSDRLGDDWQLRTFEKDVAGGTGLVKSMIRTLRRNHTSQTDPGEEVVNFEYHIIYSTSYDVPVLYFKAVQQDGSYLQIERIWSSIPQTCIRQQPANADQERFTYKQFGDVITQMEHPFLGLPFFHVHPCHTSQLLAQVAADLPAGRCRLLTWLSTVSPLVGLTVDPVFARELSSS